MSVPKAGAKLTFEDVEMIFNAISTRQQNFPGEPAPISVLTIMMNIGDRFAPVFCTVCEWDGVKSDMVATDNGVPGCPLGHPLMQGAGLALGWVATD